MAVEALCSVTVSSFISPGPARGTLRPFPIICSHNHAELNILRAMSFCSSNGFPGWVQSRRLRRLMGVSPAAQHPISVWDALEDDFQDPLSLFPVGSPTWVLSETRTDESLQCLLFWRVCEWRCAGEGSGLPRGEIFELLGAFLSPTLREACGWEAPLPGRAGRQARPGATLPSKHHLVQVIPAVLAGALPRDLAWAGGGADSQGPSPSGNFPHLLLLVSEQRLPWSEGKGAISVSHVSTVSLPCWPSGKIYTADLWPFSSSFQCSPYTARDACYVVEFG